MSSGRPGSTDFWEDEKSRCSPFFVEGGEVARLRRLRGGFRRSAGAASWGGRVCWAAVAAEPIDEDPADDLGGFVRKLAGRLEAELVALLAVPLEVDRPQIGPADVPLVAVDAGQRAGLVLAGDQVRFEVQVVVELKGDVVDELSVFQPRELEGPVAAGDRGVGRGIAEDRELGVVVKTPHRELELRIGKRRSELGVAAGAVLVRDRRQERAAVVLDVAPRAADLVKLLLEVGDRGSDQEVAEQLLVREPAVHRELLMDVVLARFRVAGLALRVGGGVDPVVEVEQPAEGGERPVVARLAVFLEDPVSVRDGAGLERPVVAAEDRDQQEQRQDAGEPDQPASPDARTVDLPRDFDVISTRNVLKATLVRHCPNPVQNMSEGPWPSTARPW